ncbi:MAG: hypothetical protein WKF92_00430 [Pyrinomonadaceae bacterium]
MVTRNTTGLEKRKADGGDVVNVIDDRLDQLLAANAEIARRKSLNISGLHERKAAVMIHPVSLERSFAYFGLMLGSLPPASIIWAIFSPSGIADGNWLIGLMLAANILTAIAGYLSGKLVSDCVRQIRDFPLWTQFALLPLIGLSWGAISGGIGGALILIYGGFIGALFGGAVGLTALPLFVILHRSLSYADTIERKHFLPIASGITLTICGFILGL